MDKLMDFNILIGGAAGQGMDTFASTFSKALQRNEYFLFTLQDYMSRVRGGHNYFQIRFSNEKVKTHCNRLDVIIALNKETIDLHIERLESNGVILADEDIESDDARLITIPALKIAKEEGNSKVFSSVMLGALLKIFGMTGKGLEEIFSEKFDEKVTGQNMGAFDRGQKLVDKKYDVPKGNSGKMMLIQSNEAIALGALAAGLKFYSAYPMTPSTSIMSYLTRKSSKAKIIAEQAEDEIAAVNMAIGASYAGVRSMTSTSGGGFSLMVEALGFAGIAEIPVVIAVIQRPGPATGLPTRTEQSDLKFVINASQGEFPRMVIALKHPEDAFYQTMRAFNLAEKYQIPVIIMGDQYMADAVQTVKPFDESRIEIERHLSDPMPYIEGRDYKRYEVTKNGISPRLLPGIINDDEEEPHGKLNRSIPVNADSDEHDEWGNITESAEVRIAMANKRMTKFELLKKELTEPEILGEENPDTLLIGWGSMYSQLDEAVDILNSKKEDGTKYGALVFGDIWPLPQEALKEKCKNAKKIINVEQNLNGQLKEIIREVTGITMNSSILRYDGRPISAEEIALKVLEV